MNDIVHPYVFRRKRLERIVFMQIDIPRQPLPTRVLGGRYIEGIQFAIAVETLRQLSGPDT